MVFSNILFTPDSSMKIHSNLNALTLIYFSQCFFLWVNGINFGFREVECWELSHVGSISSTINTANSVQLSYNLFLNSRRRINQFSSSSSEETINLIDGERHDKCWIHTCSLLCTHSVCPKTVSEWGQLLY